MEISLAKESQPAKRAADAKRDVAHVRRKYKKDLTLKRNLLPAEREHVKDMVVVLKLAGYTRSQMSRAIGISKGQVKEILEDATTNEKLGILRRALPQAALDLLQGYMIEAVQAVVDVMRTSESDKFILQAAGEILDRGGLGKVSRQDRHNLNEERLTITDDGIVDRLRELPVDQQEKAAQIVEELENMLAAAEANLAADEDDREEST